MVTPGTPITKADLDALAALANSKLSPVTPYSFAAFTGVNGISMPANITPVATYGIGSWPSGQKNTLWLFGYKTIAGVKTYTWYPLIKAFYPVSASGDYSMTWTWTNPVGATAPDGFIAVSVYPFLSGWEYIWKDIGLVSTLTEDGSFSDPNWKFDTTLDQNNAGLPGQNLPCGHGAWLKVLNQIHQDLFTSMNLFGGSSIAFDPTFLLSGPWCVSVAPKCYLYLNGTSIYDSLEFWYSESDSVTGNELAPEADMLDAYTGGTNGANTFNWTQNVTIKGRMVLLSSPNGQNAADWTLSAPPGVTASFDANYFDGVNGFVTGLIFDFDDVPYTVGTPITITATPTARGSVINAGNPAGGGLWINCVFTGDTVTYGTSDTTAIHYSGIAAKKASLPNSLSQITFTTAIGGTNALDSHHRAFCNGVFVAKTLPTLGIMPYLDQDMPQYFLLSLDNLSRRREPINTALPVPIPHVDNRGALYPVFRDTDFVPDSVAGGAVFGSEAWRGLATPYAFPHTNTSVIPPSGIGNTLTNVFAVFVSSGLSNHDIRFLANNPDVTLYAKAGGPPSISDYDVIGIGGVWCSAASQKPGYPTNTTWYVAILNPIATPQKVSSYMVILDSVSPPNGTFFPTVLDDSGNAVPTTEGYSFHWWNDANTTLLPVPLYGYCVYSITVRRQPIDNGSGILIAPSTGTPALNVDIGLMKGYSFDSQGTFQKIQTVTIPAGSASVTVSVFLPVLSGTPLAYQCGQQVMIRAAVNFQPQMHSSFSASTVKKSGADYTVGYFDGPAFYNPQYALLSFVGHDFQKPILLPVCAVVYNDLEALLNLLP